MNSSEKRQLGHDRRRHDGGPPMGWKERRRCTERRIPVVEEMEVSEAEWMQYFGRFNQHSRPSGAEFGEQAAAVLGRVVD